MGNDDLTELKEIYDLMKSGEARYTFVPPEVGQTPERLEADKANMIKAAESVGFFVTDLSEEMNRPVLRFVK